jgi:hypothetical protein
MTVPHAFTLYSTSACHLCEEAVALFQVVVPADVATLTSVDVSESDDLMDRYGVRIPVVAANTPQGERRELGWPFDIVQLGEFVDAVIEGA